MQKKPVGNGWVIFDTESNCPYINVLWKSKEIADFELKDLLKSYSGNNVWRKRLKIIYYEYAK